MKKYELGDYIRDISPEDSGIFKIETEEQLGQANNDSAFTIWQPRDKCEPVISTMSYEDWYNIHECELLIEFAETGSDREFGFDAEREFEIRYEKYLGK